MIYTLSLNPAIDETIELKRLETNGVSEFVSLTRLAAGKGVNVSRALKTLGRESVPVVLIGSGGVPFFRTQMAEAALPWISFSFEGDPRISNTLIFKENACNTHIRRPGKVPDGFDLKPIEEYLYSRVEADDIVVLSGSLPEGLSDDTYARLISNLNDRGVLTVLDASGKALEEGISSCPFCLKINMDEFIDFTEQTEEDAGDFKETLRALHREGISLIIITMGQEGAMLFDGENLFFAHSKDKLLDMEQRYTVGCGDVFLAAFLDAMQSELPLEECLKQALATAAANALTPGAAIFDPDDKKRYLAVMEMKKEN